jgi:2-dehydro-3-deoxyphosphogluconate aldolase/(4S)-4-hydroxy-2-oxoglutarate aldolase
VTDRAAIPQQIAGPGVIAIGRRLEAGSTIDVAHALAQGGIRAFEITLNEPVPAALAGIERLAGAIGGEMAIGAGTVLSIENGRRAVEAGASFLVTPHTDEPVIDWAVENGVPIFPGAFTPTEIVRAWLAGASAVKLFPASVAGPSAVREIGGPLPDIPLIPTGGVTLETMRDFIKAGAAAIGVGGWLFAEPRLDIVAARAGMAVRAVDEARAGLRGGTVGARPDDPGLGRAL